MLTLSAPRVVISGVADRVGKSLVTFGLCHELRRRGISVACAVNGPNLGQSILLRRIAGRYAYVFDDRLLTADQMLESAAQLGIGADIILVDGRSAIFDGDHTGSLHGSDAEIASRLSAPVVLVVDVRGMGASLAALIKGFTSYLPEMPIAGFVLNRTHPGRLDERGRAFYERVLDASGLGAPLGALPEMPQLRVALPGLPVTQEGNLPSLARQFLVDVGAAMREHFDVDRLLAEARTAPPIEISERDSQPWTRRCRVAVAEDSCFGVCFQENLDLLRYFGAEIVPFSPLADSVLPKRVGALYIPGACLSDYATDLSANTAMLTAIKDFAASGGAIYAEGAGGAYLCSTYRLKRGSTEYQGAGILSEHALEDAPRFAYAEVLTCDDSILGPPGLTVKGIRTGEWRLPRESRILTTMRLSSPGGHADPEGWSPGAQILVSFSFLHFGSSPEVAKSLVDNAEVVQPI